MEQMDVFFELPGMGKLMWEHSFYQLDGEPILFVCTDGKENRFLCSCCRMGENWVVGQVEEKALLDLIDEQITIREVFEQRCSAKWMVVWDGDVFRMESEVPDDVLPRKGALLELDHEKCGPYKEILLPEAFLICGTAPSEFGPP